MKMRCLISFLCHEVDRPIPGHEIVFFPSEGNLKVVQRRLPMHIIFFSQKTTSPYFSAFVSSGNFLLACAKVENLRSQSCMLFLETLREACRLPPKLAAKCNCQCGRWGKLLHQVNWILIKGFFGILDPLTFWNAVLLAYHSKTKWVSNFNYAAYFGFLDQCCKQIWVRRKEGKEQEGREGKGRKISSAPCSFAQPVRSQKLLLLQCLASVVFLKIHFTLFKHL